MKKIKESKTLYTPEPITTVTTRGTTEIPRALRERYRVAPKSRLRWMDTGEGLLVVPMEKGTRLEQPPVAQKKPRLSDEEFLKWLDTWMKEPDDWTPEQWDDFERELRTNRLKFRDIEI
jgi:bifunctional DNA-binding transcriptional regulator/antitoxin component of YhaV-PrlF toxin-antitoxin module